MTEQWHSLPKRLVCQNKTSTEIQYTNSKAIKKEISLTAKYIQGCYQWQTHNAHCTEKLVLQLTNWNIEVSRIIVLLGLLGIQ